jgi:hypothetical protein
MVFKYFKKRYNSLKKSFMVLKYFKKSYNSLKKSFIKKILFIKISINAASSSLANSTDVCLLNVPGGGGARAPAPPARHGGGAGKPIRTNKQTEI